MGRDGVYDLVVVGTGFASTFFLSDWLGRARPDAKVLVLEKGRDRDHAWQLAHLDGLERESRKSFDARHSSIPWRFTIGFGGGSNCWWACTPRMLPEDFELRSRYGVGRDWPLGYDELEPYYDRAEKIMAVSGPDDGSPFPRSTPYPLPPHRLSEPDKLLKAAYPDRFFVQPTARASRALPGRPACCANGVCGTCPIDAKFTIHNSLMAPYRDRRVTLRLGASVEHLDLEAGNVRGVVFREGEALERARGELVVLGANAIFNPHILLRSGLEHTLLGARLVEQAGLSVNVLLDGLDGFQGGTSITGHGYHLYPGSHRKHRAAALMETWNVPSLRDERGRWRQQIRLKFIFEELPDARNRVALDPAHPALPQAHFKHRSDYLMRGVRAMEASLPELLAPLPVESLAVDKDLALTESHVLGTVVMGNDPAESIVDRNLVHHQLRNLLVLGGSAFPSAAPANPTLTLAAMALRASEALFA